MMHVPMHGYLIAKIINDTIGPYTKVSNGRLYPLLAKLVEEGCIEEVEATSSGRKGDRQAKAYRITNTGILRWHQLMMDTVSNPGDYQRIFFIKSCCLKPLTPAERLYLIDHYINYCQAHVLHLQHEIKDMESDPLKHQYILSVEAVLRAMQHRIGEWQLELAWVRQLREQELAQPQELPATNAEAQL